MTSDRPYMGSDELRVTSFIAEARQVLDDLELGVKLNPSDASAGRGWTGSDLLQELHRKVKSDGYPKSLRADKSAAPSPNPRADDDGMKSLVNDPVGEAVVGELVATDPTREAAKTLRRNMEHALGDLRIIRAVLIKATPEAPAAPEDPVNVWCVVHERHKMFEPIFRGEYCRWCYDFKGAEGVEPPGSLVRARAQGRRITEAMVEAALGSRRNPERRIKKRAG